MKTKEIERLIANKIADHWYKEIHGQVAPIFGKQKLSDFAEAELKKLRIPHVVWRSGQFCPNCYSRNIIAWGPDADKCTDCECVWYA
jgi:hypothetical protein